MLRIVVACGLLLVATAAHAQANASVTLVSDDRYRGISLSGGEPALQLGAGFDADSGVYVGAFTSTARLYGHDMVRWLGYGGWAGRFRNGLNWDVGAQYTGFSGASDDSYPEFYAGLSGERIGLRLAYAWNYFGGDDDALYTSVDAQQPLSRRVRLLGHFGWLHPVQDSEAAPAYDARLGLAVHVGGFDLQLARTFLHADRSAYRYGAYPVGEDAAGDTWVIGITRSW
jgi:uncharacterized protein (TIGR02001 family)